MFTNWKLCNRHLPYDNAIRNMGAHHTVLYAVHDSLPGVGTPSTRSHHCFVVEAKEYRHHVRLPLGDCKCLQLI